MIEVIQQMIEKGMGIKRPHLNLESKLGETDIGLDSQEIVELTALLEKRFNIKLPFPCFTKLSSIGDVIESVQKNQTTKSSKPSFEGKIEAAIEMDCSAAEAYRAIYEMDQWPEKLPHVKRIDTLYNDGVYQEFLMDVLSDTGMIQVRSIRRCLPNEEITFFQPKPPKFLKHHCGGWSFQKRDAGCYVKTWHQWNLESQKAQELFPMQESMSTGARVAKLLLSHAELALSTWKSVLEGALCKS
jgi:acyl carrier protein